MTTSDRGAPTSSADPRPLIEVTDRGPDDGPAVVLHPSLGRHAADFRDLSERLNGAGYRTLAVDPRGVAATPAWGEALTLADLADDVHEAVVARGIQRAHLIGHAHGNRVMRCCASRHPRFALSVTLIAAGGRVPPDPAASESLKKCFDRTLPDEERLQAIEHAFFAPGHSGLDWLDGWYSTANARRRRADDTPVDSWWAGGTAPMLVIQGLQDLIAPPENGRLLAAERKDVRLEEIDQAGHALLPEQPAAIAQLIVDFLTDVRAR